LDRDARRSFEEKHPGVKAKSAASLFSKLREIKSTEEILLMKKAIAMTGDGIRRAAARCAPGLKECELQAEIEYEGIRQGASGLAFTSIIGSGPNSVIPHYEANRRTMESGDVVVMDVGAEYAGYAADVTRTLRSMGNSLRSRGKYIKQSDMPRMKCSKSSSREQRWATLIRKPLK